MAMWGENLPEQTSDTFRMFVPMLSMSVVVPVMMRIVVNVCAGVTHCAPTYLALLS